MAALTADRTDLDVFHDLGTAQVVLAPDDPRPAPGPARRAQSGRRDVWLAYRLRRPVADAASPTSWRGRATASASATVATSARTRSAASRWSGPPWSSPPEGRWRLYVSCATPGTKHWRVDLLEAATPEGLATARRGPSCRAARAAVKDPVISARRPVAPVGVVPPAGRPRGHRPDDHRARHQRRRRDLDVARHRARRPAGQLGRPRGPGRRGACSTGRDRAPLRRPGHRRGELGGADRVWPGSPSPAASRPSGRTRSASPRTGSGGLRYVRVVRLPDGGTRLYFEVTGRTAPTSCARCSPCRLTPAPRTTVRPPVPERYSRDPRWLFPTSS